MPGWSDVQWIPVHSHLPAPKDGPLVASGTKIAVRILTMAMMMNGGDFEVRGFHVESRQFDDDEGEGLHRVLMWAPCDGSEDLSDFIPGEASSH